MFITDLHTHIVPNVDDGSDSFDMSLEMIRMLYNQGVRNIYCTSHDGYNMGNCKLYQENFKKLQETAMGIWSDLTLHTGNEVLCEADNIKEIIDSLNQKICLPLGKSNCVLTELYTDTYVDEADIVVEQLLKNGYKPILAHIERYPALFGSDIIEKFINKGCLIQINAYSLADEKDIGIKERARKLLEKKQVHFIGSDSYRLDHRAPEIKNGVYYINCNTDVEYAEEIFYLNARKYL